MGKRPPPWVIALYGELISRIQEQTVIERSEQQLTEIKQWVEAVPKPVMAHNEHAWCQRFKSSELAQIIQIHISTVHLVLHSYSA